MPEIILKKKETTEYSKIVLGAAGGKIDFSLTGNINETLILAKVMCNWFLTATLIR